MIAYFFRFCQSDFGNLWGAWECRVVGGGEVGGEAADFGVFPHLRCLLALLRDGKATDFGDFPLLRCLLGFLPALKATNFAAFPFLRCLFPLLRGGKATDFSDFPIYAAF